MSALQNREEVFDAALRLAETDRWALVSSLLESLPDDLPGIDADDAQFHEELLRRSGDEAESVAWEDLRDELRRMP